VRNQQLLHSSEKQGHCYSKTGEANRWIQKKNNLSEQSGMSKNPLRNQCQVRKVGIIIDKLLKAHWGEV
jgi:hypothetical protein